MTNVLKLNSISKLAEKTLGAKYTVTDNCQNPEAVLVRSFAMQDWDVPSSLLCVARAGAGVNNIPFDEYAKKGIIVFNTPGANANAVKELVIASLIIASRNIIAGNQWAQTLEGDDVKKQVEKGKSSFAGNEIFGKTLGILGLGAIGRKVAAAANALGMKIVGYDPYVPDDAKGLGFVNIVDSVDEVYTNADYITIHIPYMTSTHNFINADSIAKMKDGVIIINAARGELISTEAVKSALKEKKVACYVTDFPNADCLNTENIIVIPHLGASSAEAEENCAQMAAEEIKLFLELGTIKNSVNMPAIEVEKDKAHRVAVIYSGVLTLNVTAKVSNKTGIGYAIIDSDDTIDIEAIKKENCVISVRNIY